MGATGLPSVFKQKSRGYHGATKGLPSHVAPYQLKNSLGNINSVYLAYVQFSVQEIKKNRAWPFILELQTTRFCILIVISKLTSTTNFSDAIFSSFDSRFFPRGLMYVKLLSDEPTSWIISSDGVSLDGRFP